VVADGQVVVRIGFWTVLTAHGICVVAEAVSGFGGGDVARRFRAHIVVLIGIRMPELDGLKATCPGVVEGEPRLIFLTVFALDPGSPGPAAASARALARSTWSPPSAWCVPCGHAHPV